MTRNDVGRAQMGFRAEGATHIGAHEALSVVGVSRFVVANNHVHDTLKDGIDVKESSSDGDLRNNLVEWNCSVGIYVNEADDVRV